MKTKGVVFLLLSLGIANHVLAGPLYRSPEIVVANDAGTKLYIAEVSSQTISVMDPASGKVSRRYALPVPPTGLALTPDQQRLIVTCATPEGSIFVYDVKKHNVVAYLTAGHNPTAPVVDARGERLYVSNRFDNNISVIELTSGKVLKNIAVQREPVAAILSKDGRWLLVANGLPTGRSDGNYVAAAISVIDTEMQRVTQTIALPNGSTGLKGLCLSPCGKHAYVTHILARYHLPTTQLERGWVNTNALSIIDMERRILLNTVLLDNVDRGAANPWQPACTKDGKYLCVTHAGSHELSVIDQAALLKKLAQVGTEENTSTVSRTPEDVPNDLSFLVGIRRRLRLSGKGTRGVVVIGQTAYVTEYFSDSIGKIEVTPNLYARATSLALGTPQAMTARRKGHLLFNDADMCFQQWQSCASCHPGQARQDSLNWDLLNDQLGNPKNTKSMLYSHETSPAMSLGVRDTTEAAVRAGIRHIQFTVRPEEDAVAIDTYLKSLKPVPSPHLVGGQLSAAAQRGQMVFQKAKCAKCHSGPYLTDCQAYDIGTGTGRDKDKAFDTPTLIEVWRTAPYLHDGRAATLEEVLGKFNAEDKHGKTSDLSEQERKDLSEYILSL